MKHITFMLLSVVLFSCSTVHKAAQSHKEKESTVDKSVTQQTNKTQTVTTEKADTTIETKADTTALWLYVPDTLSDPDYVQTIENNEMKFSIRATPVYKDGKKKGATINAVYVKKKEEFKVKIDKKTITNTEAQTQIKNDISQQKTTNDKTKAVDKKPTNFIQMFSIIGFVLLFIILFVAYKYLKKQYT